MHFSQAIVFQIQTEISGIAFTWLPMGATLLNIVKTFYMPSTYAHRALVS